MPRRTKKKPELKGRYNLRKRSRKNESDSIVFVSATKRKSEVLKAKKQILTRMQSRVFGRSQGYHRDFSHFSTQTDESCFNFLHGERTTCCCFPGPSRTPIANSNTLQTLYENERYAHSKDTQTSNEDSSTDAFRTVPTSSDAGGNNSGEGNSADISASDPNSEANQHSLDVTANNHVESASTQDEEPPSQNAPPVFGQVSSEPTIESILDSTRSVSTGYQNCPGIPIDIDDPCGNGDGMHNDPLDVEIIDLGDMSVREYFENLR